MGNPGGAGDIVRQFLTRGQKLNDYLKVRKQ